MKTKRSFNYVLFILALAVFFGLGTNNLNAQHSKRKIVRIVEVDDKGERVIKEYDASKDEAKYDSVIRDISEKMKIERFKMDSLQKTLWQQIPQFTEGLPMPEVPELDLNFDFPIAPNAPDAFFLEPDKDFSLITPFSEDGQSKIYYSEKGIDNGDKLNNILEELEDGTFDPKKWDIKEIEKDKLKDFKANGKGDIIIYDGNKMSIPQLRYFNVKPYKKHSIILRNRPHGNNENHNYFFDSDSTENEKGESNWEVVEVVTSDGTRQKVSIEAGLDSEKEMKKIYFIDNGKATKLKFEKPSVEELNMLTKAGIKDADKTKKLDFESFELIPKKERGVFSFNLQDDEPGKAKYTITDDKGNTIKSEEFEHAKGWTKKEIVLKDLKSGQYFIQVQLNSKSIIMRMDLDIPNN